jgi:exopolyphosphatase/pppGpp-phosphohydrolase
MLPFSNKERLVIGSIARYHRKGLPNKKHDHYRALEPDEQRAVDILAGILRLADALDYTHSQRVEKARCRITARKITVTCHVSVEAPEEYQAALLKGDLLEKTFDRKLVLEGLA